MSINAEALGQQRSFWSSLLLSPPDSRLQKRRDGYRHEKDSQQEHADTETARAAADGDQNPTDRRERNSQRRPSEEERARSPLVSCPRI
jgi:hypothetical protein